MKLGAALKNNGMRRDAVSIQMNGRGGGTAMFIYLEGFFRAYNAGEMDLEECIKEIVGLNEGNRCPLPVEQLSARLLDWDAVHEKVFPALISTGKNTELLGRLVSEPLLDLSVIYIIRYTAEGGNNYSVKITHRMMEHYGISAQRLHEQAMRNMEKDGYGFCELGGYIHGGADIGLKMEKAVRMEEGKMYILRNRSGLYGAAGILNNKAIQGFLKGHSCFILPSSIHETIFLMASDNMNQGELDRMVDEINRTCVDEEERLADHSYYYDAEDEEIRVCA